MQPAGPFDPKQEFQEGIGIVEEDTDALDMTKRPASRTVGDGRVSINAVQIERLH